MPEEIILNHVILEKLGESYQSIVYKAYKKDKPDHLLSVKVLKSSHLAEYQKKYFLQKVEQLRVLNDPMLMTPHSFEYKDGHYFIVRDFFEGVCLEKWANLQEKNNLENFFIVACHLAKALEIIHEAGIIHGGIKPSNILVNQQDLSIRIINFISSFDVREISHFIYDRVFVEGTLAYTSPEQTGRINHRVDFSSDLYSLGIIFYKLLTGKLPFFSLDPLELIHSHLAEEAKCVITINPLVPKVLSDIVSKLILKQPEKRYQTSKGLLADLQNCKNEYFEKKHISIFPLGRYDYTRRVIFISKMVGRKNESKTILNEYSKVCRGSFHALFISGLPGIGKTRIIQELQKPIVKNRGYFTSGKFDIYQKNIPYSALIQSLRNLIRTFLTESDERVSYWKQRIEEAVSFNRKVISAVIPELEALIGPQPEVKPLPPVESKNRFNLLFGKFLGCLSSKENPLVIFIDDLQWCDNATFDFLDNLFVNSKEYHYLFFVGAYRDNEVNLSHPLFKLISNIKDKKWSLKEIRLESLKSQYCQEMVSYILDSPLSETEELSKFINNLSEGNPLFLGEILFYLHNENLIYLDVNRYWKWNLDKIRESNMPSTVVALFSSKVKMLPFATIDLLEYCACMGNRFSPTEISLVKETSLSEVFEILKLALALGLLMETKDEFQFVHDRVQESVLNEIDANRKRRIHWKIGTHFLKPVGTDIDLEKNNDIFSIASHLNLGKPSKIDKETTYTLARINYHAGNKALMSLATTAANEYFRMAKNVLLKDSWNSHYEESFKIYQKSAKTELMCGDYATSEKLLNLLLENAKSDLDKAECLAEQTTSLSSIGNFIKAIETANRGLSYFGKTIPTDSKDANKKREQLMNDIESNDLDVWSIILNMPFTKERKSKIELSFYSELIPDFYMSGLVPQLYLSAVMSTLHCLSGGMDESVIYSFAIMALYLSEKGEFDKAFKYEDLARNLSEKYPNTFGATRGMNGIVWCNMHTRSHPQDIVAYCLKSIQCGKNSGDLYNAGLSYGPLMWNYQVQGNDFQKIEDYANECLDFSNKYHLKFSVRLAEAMKYGWIEPMKNKHSHTHIIKNIHLWVKDNHISCAGSYFVHIGIVSYYFGKFKKAEFYLQKVNDYLTGLTDNVLKRQWHVFLVLNALALHAEGVKYKSKQSVSEYIEPLIKKVEEWAKYGPLLKPYLAFLYAEVERVIGDIREAKTLYQEAIETAHYYGYTFLEGYINECLGEFTEMHSKFGLIPLHYESKDKNKKKCTFESRYNEKIYSLKYFKEALLLYKKCKAEGKIILLIDKHTDLIEDEPVSVMPASMEISPILPNIDFDYLMKLYLIIPAEMGEDVLLHKIMNVVLESSGAQHGFLIIKENNDLFIRAESHITEKEIVRTKKEKFEDYKNICHAIVRYVYRTRELLILENAFEEGKFKTNLEVQKMELRSVLCIPVIKQNYLIGVLYLENRLSEGIFTHERTEMVRLLAYQAAISLENTRLVEKMRQTEAVLQQHHDHLEEMVEERTRQLRKTQEDLIVAERLAILGQLSGSISHEIRNPLNVISSSAYFLKLKLGNYDKKVHEHIERIESEVKKSTATIDSLLSLSGIKSVKKELVNIKSIINDALVASRIPEGIEIIKMFLDSDIYVKVDKDQLCMAFHNIIKNGIEAMNKKGRLSIQVVKNKSTVEVSFEDTGVGIQTENISKIFQPLFTTKAKGIGFGLSICKMIIQKNDGFINVKSEVNKGAKFTVQFPVDS